MERQEILDILINIIKQDICCVSYDTQITEETIINDLQFDEFDSVEIEIALESKLELPLESCDSIIDNSETIKDVIDKLLNLLNN